jgi:hypothetical protein
MWDPQLLRPYRPPRPVTGTYLLYSFWTSVSGTSSNVSEEFTSSILSVVNQVSDKQEPGNNLLFDREDLGSVFSLNVRLIVFCMIYMKYELLSS